MTGTVLRYYNILLGVPAGNFYTYACEGDLHRGERVVVMFGKREMTGIVLCACQKPEFECREILMRYDEAPLFGEKWLDFIEALATYYSVQLGLALQGILSDKLLNLENAAAETLATHQREDIELTPVQLGILNGMELEKFSRNLIHGITGSGKTEVYLEAAKKVIAKGKQVLYVVPEISLTPQLMDRIKRRFGQDMPSFHSKLNMNKRQSAFLSFARGETPFLTGARSALFVPAKNLGLIIVDEEHEPSFKQEESPAYHLRDMAVLYASILDIPVIMGSATPSLESMHNAKAGKYNLFKMMDRPKNAVLPDIEMIDAKSHDLIHGMIAEPIYDKLSETISKGEQAIIFLNRKGYSTSLFCKRCGQPVMCQNCSVGLTYYKSRNTLSCRYCATDYKRHNCAACGGTELVEWGAGTEKVAEFLETMFPNKVLRIDTDNTPSYSLLKTALGKFERKEAQILVGTQLVAKGLHFPSVTFVGVLGIDNLLAMPDFRATERAYQLLIQVSGRAGREELHGKVYIQTLTPEAPIFRHIVQDPDIFYSEELARRESAHFPPYSKMARLIFSHTDTKKVWDTAVKICKILRENHRSVRVLGPAEAEISKIKAKNRVSVILRTNSNVALTAALKTANTEFDKIKQGAMIMKTDKDPYFMM